MIKFKLKIILAGMLGITMIAIIAALTLDCKEWGVYIALWDVTSILLWIVVGNYIINGYLKNKK